tara:strand:- start:677 stop:1297 length:621 start_codon:yes stop_codon:yes gene_type:complete
MTKSDKKIEEKPSSEDKNNNQKVEAEENKNITEEETIENKLKVVEDKLLRTAAEMENQRKRFEKERHDAFEFGGFNFARESLSLLDNIDRAVTSFKNDENLKKNKDLNKIIEGVEIVKNDLVSIFKKNGIELIECINKKFDPNFHQAMLEIEDDDKEVGTVVQEIQKGYMMKDRLLRPSLVGVTKKRAKKSENSANNDEKNKEKSK